jgi:hypothetical protein
MRGWMAGTLWDCLGETHHPFDRRRVHFIGPDNVSRAEPEVNPEEPAWLNKDLERFPNSAPIVVFTQRPWLDLNPDGSG